jgi:hypothetical protein
MDFTFTSSFVFTLKTAAAVCGTVDGQHFHLVYHAQGWRHESSLASYVEAGRPGAPRVGIVHGLLYRVVPAAASYRGRHDGHTHTLADRRCATIHGIMCGTYVKCGRLRLLL